MTPTAIIASAWASERDRYQIAPYGSDGFGPTSYMVFDRQAEAKILTGAHATCQAHLDQLCAAAVERALAEAGHVRIISRDEFDLPASVLDVGRRELASYNTERDHPTEVVDRIFSAMFSEVLKVKGVSWVVESAKFR